MWHLHTPFTVLWRNLRRMRSKRCKGFWWIRIHFVCRSCQYAKWTYKLASYHIYKTQIRTIKNCQICNDPVSHDAENGDKACSANIDHDHDTGITRGVLCSPCNQSEGIINTWAKNLNTDLLGVIELLKDYLENPPLDQSWTQDFSWFVKIDRKTDTRSSATNLTF